VIFFLNLTGPEVHGILVEKLKLPRKQVQKQTAKTFFYLENTLRRPEI